MSSEDNVVAEELGPFRKFRWNLSRWWLWNVSRKLPRLVWYGDELDVGVRFSQDPLIEATVSDPLDQEEVEACLASFNSGALYEVECQLKDLGIAFDTGQGGAGRDWEWDYSLSGPISVKFRGRAKKPERRMARPTPKLVVQND